MKSKSFPSDFIVIRGNDGHLFRQSKGNKHYKLSLAGRREGGRESDAAATTEPKILA